MRKKVLCITLVLLMSMMITFPSFADGSVETPLTRAEITVTFGLKHISGSTYKMWARISNPTQTTVNVILTLYDSTYNPITSIGTTATYSIISLNKNVSLSSGTYHLRLTYTADGATYSAERTYTI